MWFTIIRVINSKNAVGPTCVTNTNLDQNLTPFMDYHFNTPVIVDFFEP
jgi:hypothetical protein